MLYKREPGPTDRTYEREPGPTDRTYEREPGPTDRTYEEREVLSDNIDHSTDAQNLKYQNMH